MIQKCELFNLSSFIYVIYVIGSFWQDSEVLMEDTLNFAKEVLYRNSDSLILNNRNDTLEKRNELKGAFNREVCMNLKCGNGYHFFKIDNKSLILNYWDDVLSYRWDTVELVVRIFLMKMELERTLLCVYLRHWLRDRLHR